MNPTELLLLSIGLAADACAVSMTDGMCEKHGTKLKYLGIACCFGVMQALMPLLGFYTGSAFSSYIAAFDHIIALVLLAGIGGKQIAEACCVREAEAVSLLSVPVILMQGIATSLDAFVVGIGFAAFSALRIIPSVSLIGTVTFVCSLCGIWLGKRCGQMLGKKAQICGGLILIGIGLRIFLSHMFG